MKPLLTAEEMRLLEHRAIDGWGIPSVVLQEHAAWGALALLPPDAPLEVLAGPGNNGGDALALARLARCQGRSVRVWAWTEQPTWTGDAARQAALWTGMGGTFTPHASPADAVAQFRGWVVDGLFGLGTRLPLAGRMLEWVEALNRGRAQDHFRILALDLPTGLDPSSGALQGPAVRADATACFGHLKRCHGLRPAKDCCGSITVVALPLAESPVAELEVLAFEGVRPAWAAHKRQQGQVVVRAGSLGMSGAAVLAALGALAGGAGLVTVLTEDSIRAEVAAQIPEAMVRTWDGRLPEADVLLVGPGGVSEIPDWGGPLVLDASALRPGEGPRWMARPNTVLTPHAGEWQRLFGGEGLPGDQPDVRLDAVKAWSQAPGILVLKGAQTLIAGGAQPTLWVNPTGHAGLATGGTGDFLAGLVAGRVAQAHRAGRSLVSAVAEAVWLHGAAADALGTGPVKVTDLGPGVRHLLGQVHA